MSESKTGRFYPKLTKGERQFVIKEAERHGVTPNQMLEAMTLFFLKKHDPQIYEDARKHADSEALRLLETEMSEKELAMKTLEAQMVDVTVRLYKPFYDFIKEYLAFFGSKQTIEDLCRSMIYEDVESLYESLKGFPHLDKGDWFNKWQHIAIVSFPDPEEEES